MRFWDTSAIVPLLVQERLSERADQLFAEDRAIVVWWGTVVECSSALARLRRDAALDAKGLQAAAARLKGLATSWIEVPAASQVRDQALRMLRIHLLRAGDALQLAAALVAADFRPGELGFVTLDSRQGEAADREGFPVIT